ncbi:MAG: class II aldolase/adducin family protein [Chloroflexi bacterium]|nr:MAG: class II aldolase/adducin family protein [Chloroflexota bacterium]
MNETIQKTRIRVAELGLMLFERKLTDAAGGNISVRVGDLICITPRYAGSKHQWHLRPDQVLVTDMQGCKLDGDGDISREARVHYRIYQDFPDATSVVHCHAQNALVFASACRPIEPVLEDTLKFGTIIVTGYAPAHSDQLAEFISNGLCGQEDRIRTQAAAVLAPWHGLFVAGKNLEAAFDAAERIDTNARCILFSRLLPGDAAPSPGENRLNLETSMQDFS